MSERIPSDPSPIQIFIHQPYIPTDEEIEKERQRRKEADRKRSAAPPLNPLPSTPSAFLAECAKQRGRIVAAMRRGQQFHPGTDANFIAALKGEKTGFFLPPLERLWHAATVLDLRGSPPFPGEPQTALDAIAALDSLLAATQGTTPAPHDENTKKSRKHGGGRQRLEQSNRLKANAYEYIRQARRPREPYTDLANRLKHDKDFMELAKAAGVTRINYRTIRNAIEHERQRQREARKKQETEPA